MIPAYLGALLLLAGAANAAYSSVPPGSHAPPHWNQPHPGGQLHNSQQYSSPQHPQEYAEVATPMDLTHPLDTKSLEWPNNTAFIHENVTADNERGYFYASQDIRLGEHVGTHMDAPYHFNAVGHKIGYISVSKLIAKAIILDGDHRRNATVGVEHLRGWQKRNGPLPNPCVVLIRFNWSQYYPQREDYFAYSNGRPTEFEFPGITEELAKELAHRKEVVGVGIDTPSIDPGQQKELLAHRHLAEGNKYILENLLLSPKLPPKGWTIIVMPIKLTEGTGAPCRVVAIPYGYNKATSTSITVSVIAIMALSAIGRDLIT